MSSYPGSIWSPTTKTNKVDLVDAAHMNDAQDEIVALEEELGTDVAGSETDLKTRLAYNVEDNGSFKHGTSFPGSPRTGDRFFRTDLNVDYVYNGSSWVPNSGLNTYLAGDFLYGDPSHFSQIGATSYTKYAEFYINGTGTLRIKFWLMRTSAGSVDGRIYRNGSAVGTNRNESTGTATEYSEDISGWAKGDLCQLYCKVDNNQSMAGGMRIYTDSSPSQNVVGAFPPRSLNYFGAFGGDTIVGTAFGNQGDTYQRTDGGATTSLYVKTGATTWTAK